MYPVMSTPKTFSPLDVDRAVATEEIRRRTRFPPEAVERIFRYGAIVGHVIEHLEQVPRGMDLARQRIRQAEEANRSFASGTVILADAMMQSRGRFQRPWHAPRGGLWMTVVLVNTLLPENSLLVPMAAGVASCETLLSCGIAARIKWVNDILVDNRKISGILTETFTGPRSGEEYILVGIGINVNNSEFPPELAGQATSVKACLGREFYVENLAVQLLANLRWNFGLLSDEEARHLETHGGIGRDSNLAAGEKRPAEHLLLQSYRSMTDVLNRKVRFGFDVVQKPLFEARVVAIDRSGGLVLELEDSSRTVQHSGEIIYLD
jgi:BirA family biotin operon repressor/biotin-[acetyl-CoA-carboxylase] ligase